MQHIVFALLLLIVPSLGIVAAAYSVKRDQAAESKRTHATRHD